MSSLNDLQFSQDFLSPDEYVAVVEHITNDNPNLIGIVDGTEQLFEDNYDEPEQKYLIPWVQPDFQQFVPPLDENSLSAMPMVTHLSIPQVPANVEFQGMLNFNIKVTSAASSRNRWSYSSVLKKVYTLVNTVLPVEVQCKSLPNREELFLRATPLFSLPQYEHELVQRCTVHQQQNQNLPKNDNVEPHILKHVLRCSNHGSMYMGNVDTNDHLNVRTPLPQPQAGIDTVRINYEFMCKNSCPSGMNRRATDIIFTLENAYGEVLGRRKLGVRVCSCPKRDKEKEEQEFKEAQKQNSTQNNNGVPMRKKRKLGKKPSDNELANGERKNLDNSLVTIPGIEVLGRDIALDTLRFVQDRMIAEMHHGRFNGNETQAKECIKNLESLMKDFKE